MLLDLILNDEPVERSAIKDLLMQAIFHDNEDPAVVKGLLQTYNALLERDEAKVTWLSGNEVFDAYREWYWKGYLYVLPQAKPSDDALPWAQHFINHGLSYPRKLVQTISQACGARDARRAKGFYAYSQKVDTLMKAGKTLDQAIAEAG